MVDLTNFLFSARISPENSLPAVSLFSGAGLSDLGYERAGFKFLIHSEIEHSRIRLCAENHPGSICLEGDLLWKWREVVSEYWNQADSPPALVAVTPPCQGMSSSNPGRGKISDPKTSDDRNLLIMAAVPVINALQPRIIVVENVPQMLKRVVDLGDGQCCRVVDAFQQGVGSNYAFFLHIVQMADYGIPQDRRRAILVAIRSSENCIQELRSSQLLPLPVPTHDVEPRNGLLPWVTLEEWLKHMDYSPLDAGSVETSKNESDCLHRIPHYGSDRYSMVSDIPAHSGKSAYQNSTCRGCEFQEVPEGISCPKCGDIMRNRPHVVDKNGNYRLIKGFKSSYRRMYPKRPAPTVTTSSSHLGSDYKIHPWENRVLSIRECADLQTIPRFFDWSWAFDNRQIYLIRRVVGEALPPWFTFLHGQILVNLLTGSIKTEALATKSTSKRNGRSRLVK